MTWYMKSGAILLNIFLAMYIVYIGRSMLVPLTFGIFFALFMLPLVNWVEKRVRLPRFLAIALVLGVSVVIAILLGSLMSSQVIGLLRDALARQDIVDISPSNIQAIVQQTFTRQSIADLLHGHLQLLFDLNGEFLDMMLDKVQTNIVTGLQLAVGSLTQMFLMTGQTMITSLIVLTYTFLLLLYRDRFNDCIKQVLQGQRYEKAFAIRDEVLSIMPRYLLGVVMIVALESIVNSIGLYFIGIGNPFFWGVFVALFYVIPFFGIWIGGAIAVSYILLSYGFVKALFAIGLFLGVQLVENYIIVPLVMATQIRLNPLAIISVVILGGVLWGAAGMVLFMPLLAMGNIIMQHIPSLRPYAELLKA